MNLRPNSSPRRRFDTRGMTLLELLLVMVVMGVVMGLGVGTFASLDPGRGTAASTVRGALRSAVQSAKANRAPAVVQLDAKTGELTPRGLVTVGTWHFEGLGLRGAFGVDGIGTNIEKSPGVLGEALEFPAGARARAEFAIQDDPSFEFSGGFAIECQIAPDASSSAHAISVGNVFGLYVLATGAVRVWFYSVDQDGEQSGQVVLDSEAALLLPGEWSKVRVEYDRRELMIVVDGVRVARMEASEEVARVQAPMMLGGGQKPFVGRIDELVLSAWTIGEIRKLPASVVLDKETPAEIGFDAAGHLDALRHPEALELGLTHLSGRRELVRVGRWGTIE